MDIMGATLQEIQTQTAAWDEAVDIVRSGRTRLEGLPWREYEQLIFCGCGSTYYLSLSAAALFQSLTGKISRAFPSSELLLNPSSVYTDGASSSLLLAVSRSGTTTETLRAVESYRARKQGDVLSVTNTEESPLAHMGEVNLCIPSGKEKSIAQTKSFASMYVACTALAAWVGKNTELTDELPGLIPAGQRILNVYDGVARQQGEDHELNRFFFLGSGIRYGLACEASLKMKEMSLTVSEPFHFPEFRHGPISMVDKNTLVVGLLSDENRDFEKAVLSDVQKLGGRTLSLGETGTDVAFHSGVPEPVRAVLYLPFLQLLAYHRAVSFGLNPDRPRNLTAVVELESLDLS